MLSVVATDAVETAAPGTGWIVRCHECDKLQRVPPLAHGSAAECSRCGSLLFASKPEGLERGFVLYLAALILLVIANSFPFLTLKAQGHVQPSRLLSGAIDIWRDGMPEVGIVVILFVLVAPLLKIVIGLLVVGPLAFDRKIRGAKGLYRLYETLHPWAMMEIFLLGVLVSYTKIVNLATVEVGPSMYAFIALILTTIAADSSVDTHDVWERLKPSRTATMPPPGEQADWIGCHTCQLLCHLPRHLEHAGATCPRCGSPLHRRKHDSLNRTGALLFTAALLYIPANVYPVMTFTSLGSGEPSTILGGVEELIAANMWPLALIVFVASILVPMLKLISMTYLVLSVRFRSHWRLSERTFIYRLNELVGRWSMVDVFVITLLAALVRLGSIASITPGIGIVAFASVVIITMTAALTFDPRLIWDAAGANDEPR